MADERSKSHREYKESKKRPFVVALVGNPSVGKSALFTNLTGIGVIVSNYPGTTVEMKKGILKVKDRTIDIVDLPGIYSFSTFSEDEVVARRFVYDERPDVIVNVVDASRLERNLNLTLQLLELGIPMVVALNQVDAAESMGISIDVDLLSKQLGCPVIATIATEGSGLEKLIEAAISPIAPIDTSGYRRVDYDGHVEDALETLMAYPALSSLSTLPTSSPSSSLSSPLPSSQFSSQRQMCIRLLEGDLDVTERQYFPEDVRQYAAVLAGEIEKQHNVSMSEMVVRCRFGEAGAISDAVTTHTKVKDDWQKRVARIDHLLTSGNTSLLLLCCVFALMFAFVFTVGTRLELLIIDIFEAGIINPLSAYLDGVNPFVSTAVLNAFVGMEAGLAIVVPFIMTFYIALSVLEDSGYLTRAAFILDRYMHKLGLHGQAAIPILLGFGCTVPSIMASRMLGSKRERFIVCTLASLVPCSARTVVIVGLVATFVGIPEAISIYLLVFAIIVSVGWILGRKLPGEQIGFLMEMAPLRLPRAGAVMLKTWIHMRGFVLRAFPLLIVGSAALGVIDEAGLLDVFQDVVAPVSVGLLGLPAFAATALVFGFLRKEMAVSILAVMAGTAYFPDVMTDLQLYVFALVTTIYVPCIATVAVLKHELGLKSTIHISVFTVVLAIVLGSILNYFGTVFL